MITGIKPIKALSFWRFTRLNRCQVSGAFPSSTTASFFPKERQTKPQVLGNLFHSLMEEFHRIRHEGTLDQKAFILGFNRIVNDMSQELAANSMTQHLANITSWPELSEIYNSFSDFLLRATPSAGSMPMEAHSEKTLYSKDGLLFGQIDAYFIHQNRIELVDYKSGKVLEDDIPKEDYVNQLYFYAYLIFENHGIYPEVLRLIGKNAEVIEIEPNIEKSVNLANQMRSVLASYNRATEKPFDGLRQKIPV